MSEKKFRARQEELEALACEVLVEDGISGFSIERIANRSGYSRPTIYQHFSSIDDALERVASSAIRLAKEMIERGIAYNGSPFHRVLTISVAYEQVGRFHPLQFHIGELLGHPWISRRLPDGVRTAYEEFVALQTSALSTLFEEAQTAGDLVLRPGADVRQLTFHTIATLIGVYSSIVKERQIFHFANSETPWRDALECTAALLDGYGWAADGAELDTVYDHIMRTCYPDYWIKAQTEELAAQVKLPVGTGPD